MGGVFRSPSPAPVVDTQAIAAAAAEEERKKAQERRRRGLEGTVKTSYTGILDSDDKEFKRKKLLGE